MVHSFAIHITQCQDLFEKREAQKPLKERRSCPTDPTLRMKGDLDSMNAAAHEEWNTKMLMKCRHCGRSFLPEKLQIHNKSCTASNPARRVQEPISKTTLTNSYSEYEDNGNFVQCRDCGRSFNSSSFAKHAKVCRDVFMSKRKQYDSSKHRKEGTEMEGFGASKRFGKKKNMVSNTTEQSNTRKAADNSIPKWKADSMKLRDAMRMARKACSVNFMCVVLCCVCVVLARKACVVKTLDV